ncbi:hypothetical protein AAHZ94_14920 [Streptomyces sp. HSW2009]|uniref:hypothetical protein n=1 Tax=Streptomyces sp. HSW2009 TaxID=3142890 RepID=UPI0032EC89B6
MLEYVDRIRQRLRRDHPRSRPDEPAGPGIWLPRTQYAAGSGLIQGRTVIPVFADGGEEEAAARAELPEVRTVPYQEEIALPAGELLELARLIDGRYPAADRYVHAVLENLFAQLQTTDAVPAQELIRLGAGPMGILNAPTGTGKSVLVRVAASWYAVNGLTVTLVLPTVEATLSAAWDISQDLKHLGRTETCTPLMSPSRLHERAMKAAARIEGSLLEQSDKTLWKLDQPVLRLRAQPSHPVQPSVPARPGAVPRAVPTAAGDRPGRVPVDGHLRQVCPAPAGVHRLGGGDQSPQLHDRSLSAGHPAGRAGRRGCVGGRVRAAPFKHRHDR